jgi:tetratricopeptide (TPR) repeat protein
MLLVAIATLSVFLPVLRHEFLDWDDAQNLVNNPHYRGLGIAQLRWMFTTIHMGHYIPLTWVTFGFDYLVWGLNPAGYHLTNLALHVANAVVFFLVALRLLTAALAPAARSKRGHLVLGAGFAALVFAVHPLRVESVAWVTERRDVLSGLFYLTALLAYLKSCAHEETTAPRRWYGLSLVLFALGLVSKSSVVTLPAVLLVLDVYPLRRLGAGGGGWLGAEARAVLREKVPYFALGAVASVVAFVALIPLGNMASMASVGVAGRAGITLYDIVFYLWKTVAPARLSPMYELPQRIEALRWTFALSALVVLVVTGLALVLRRRLPGLAAVWIAYTVTLLPLTGAFQNGPQIAADRYTYLACLGWAALAGGVVAAVSRSSFVRPSVGLGLVVAVVLALGALTWQQVAVWRDSETLWSHAVRLDPDNSVAANNLGAALLAQGRSAEAERQFRRTIHEVDVAGRAPSNDVAARYFTLALSLQREGKLEEAAGYYRKALDVDPKFVDAWNNLGVLDATRAEYQGAFAAFVQALTVDPKSATACSNGRRAAKILGASHPLLEQCQGVNTGR